jgi:reverse transcriptase-like protein
VAHRVDPIVARWQPKPFGGPRRMALLSERDADAWHRLTGRIAEIIEPRLGPRILANRVPAPGPHWSLQPVGSELRRARRARARMHASVAVRTDVAAYYASVTPPALFRALRRLEVLAEDAGTAADMLDGWGSEGYPGLPIGPPGSAVLGNAVLAAVDADLEPDRYLRWVDDYLITVSSERHAMLAVERLDAALGRLGLLRSVAKTAVFDGGEPVGWLGLSPAGC